MQDPHGQKIHALVAGAANSEFAEHQHNKILKHFIRQLFGLPVGGKYKNVRIRFIGHDAFLIVAENRRATVHIRTSVHGGRRVSEIDRRSLERWEDGSPMAEEAKENLLGATVYWLNTQGNIAVVVPEAR